MERGQRPIITDYRLIPLDSTIEHEPAIDAKLKAWQAKLPAEEILGYLSAPIHTRQEIKGAGESTAGNFYVDALLAFVRANVHSEADLAFAHMGTLRGDRVYEAGMFTNHDLNEYHPSPNPPILRELNAPQIKTILEWGVSALSEALGSFVPQAGLTVTIDLTRPAQTLDLKNQLILSPGQRVVHAEFQGESLDWINEERTFTVVLDGYMGMGGAGFYSIPEAPLHCVVDAAG